MWFKLPTNKNIQKTIFNIVSLYLFTTILLVISISFIYLSNQKQAIFRLHKTQSDIQAHYILEQLELLHDNIASEIAIYPRLDNVQSAIYDIDKKLIFSTFTQKIKLTNKPYIIKDDYIYFVKQIEPYYLGAAYIVIQTQTTHELKLKYQQVILLTILIVLFLIFTSFMLAKLLIKPLSDNLLLLDRFIRDTTHELNTPLSAILNNIEMLNYSTLDTQNIKKINRIKIGATTISTIYNDLSFLLLTNKSKSNNQTIDISNILYERLEYFNTLANSRKLTFNTNIQEDIYITIDKIKLERLFDNLISNAIKYSYPNNKINITLSTNHFIIEDFGIGIKKENLKDIFTRYKRFENSVGGFGIGYNIIKQIIDEYNITIDIQSYPQKGTKVILKWQN